MKKMNLLILVGFLIVSCGTKIESDYFEYKEGVTFRVNRSSAMPMTASGLNTTTVDVAGTRFVTLSMSFKNNTNSTQEIDFDNIFILDDANKKHKVTKAAKSLGVLRYDNFVFKLKKGKERVFAITFSGVPRDELVRRFEMDGRIVTIR